MSIDQISVFLIGALTLVAGIVVTAMRERIARSQYRSHSEFFGERPLGVGPKGYLVVSTIVGVAWVLLGLAFIVGALAR